MAHSLPCKWKPCSTNHGSVLCRWKTILLPVERLLAGSLGKIVLLCSRWERLRSHLEFTEAQNSRSRGGYLEQPWLGHTFRGLSCNMVYSGHQWSVESVCCWHGDSPSGCCLASNCFLKAARKVQVVSTSCLQCPCLVKGVFIINTNNDLTLLYCASVMFNSCSRAPAGRGGSF